MSNLISKHLRNGTRNYRNVSRNSFTNTLMETYCCVLVEEKVSRKMKISLSDNILLKVTENKWRYHRFCEEHRQKQSKSSSFSLVFGNGNISHFRYVNHHHSLTGQPMLIEISFTSQLCDRATIKVSICSTHLYNFITLENLSLQTNFPEIWYFKSISY